MAILAKNRTSLFVTRIAANGDQETVDCPLADCHRYHVRLGGIIVDVNPANDNQDTRISTWWVTVQLSPIVQNIFCNIVATIILLICQIQT